MMLLWLHREARWLAMADAGVLIAITAPRPIMRRGSASATLSYPILRPTAARRALAPDRIGFVPTSRKAELGLSEPRTGIAQEQSRRVFSQVDKAAREKDAAFQVAWISPTILVHSRRSARHLRHRTAFDISANNGCPSRRCIWGMASGHCNVKRVVRFSLSRRHLEVPVTVPIGLMPDVILENERGLLPGPDG
jgi:hypothetical protein